MIERRQTDIVVIGGGPAGIGAALAAASTGAKVHLIDSFPEVGGQYWMQPPLTVQQRGPQVRQGADRVAALRQAGVTIHVGSEVWGIVDRFRVLAQRRQHSSDLEVKAAALVVCTGAHDRVIPFPGWTLPGVMTAGGGQRFAKIFGRAPGRRIVVAGTGVFLWAVAGSVLKAGGKVAALIDLNPRPSTLVRHLLRYPKRWREAASLVLPVLASRVPLHFGRAIVAAEGNGHVEAVRHRRIGSIQAGSTADEQQINNIDCLLIGHGFRPSIEITAFLRCRHTYEESQGGWHCAADPESGATSVPGVFAAGEVTGFAGATPGWLRGQLAGLGAAESIGFKAPKSTTRNELKVRLSRAQQFADGLNRISVCPPQLADLADAGTIVCRCEEVTVADIRDAIADGADSVYAAKLWSRAGMGRCQGRTCGDAVARLVAEATGIGVSEMGFNQPRLPMRPVPLSRVAAALGDRDVEQNAK